MSYSKEPHVALIPSSGMGHLVPFLRLAALLVGRHCKLTLIIADHLVSSAESQLITRFLSVFPQVTVNNFNPLPLDSSTSNSSIDPFVLQWETIGRSAHLLSPILSSLSPPLSFVISDVTLVSPLSPITQNLQLPNYVLFPSSARMLNFWSHFSSIAVSMSDDGSFQFNELIDVPFIEPPLPKSSIPLPLLNSNSPFTKIFLQGSSSLMKINGILINTFEGLEKQSLQVFDGMKISEQSFPLVLPVGPLLPGEFEGKESVETIKWLDDQKEGSVVLVGFGSRLASSNAQIREMAKGLMLSGCKFLWVVKTKVVDKEEDGDLHDIIGNDLLQMINTSKIGLILKWVNQWEILSHRAVGGFVSHCGWNSIVESALYGVPLLGCPPRLGDWRINRETIQHAGWVMCMDNWEWDGETALVKGEEIGEKVKQLIESKTLKMEAAKISAASRIAAGAGGSCENALLKLLQNWK